jgi:hypothetical protein
MYVRILGRGFTVSERLRNTDLKDTFLLQHLLPLPGFLILYENIYSHIISFAHSAPVTIPVIGVGLPKLYLYLAGNVVTQYPLVMFYRLWL